VCCEKNWPNITQQQLWKKIVELHVDMKSFRCAYPWWPIKIHPKRGVSDPVYPGVQGSIWPSSKNNHNMETKWNQLKPEPGSNWSLAPVFHSANPQVGGTPGTPSLRKKSQVGVVAGVSRNSQKRCTLGWIFDKRTPAGFGLSSGTGIWSRKLR